MRHFTATELTRMRSTQDGAMQDTCRIGAYTADDDAYNLPDVTYVYGDEVICGLELMRPAEEQASGEVPVIDAILRLPIDTEIDERDRVRMEQRYNEALTVPQVFEIEGPVKRGPSGLRLDLRLVDDGSGLEHGV
jgi:hypothetical protein